MSRNSSMFQRLDSFAKKMKTSERTPRSSDKKHHKHHKRDENKEATDGARHIDHEDLDMNLLIGPNKGKTAAQIIDELDPRYFQEHYDPLTEILSSLPAQQSQRSDDLLEAKLNELDVVKLCIDKRLSNQVFANYHHFVDGLSLIGDIKDDLFESSLLCTDGRARLAAVSKELTLSIFSTLQHSQRTARLLTIQSHLQEINTLLRREKEITLLLKEGEFLSAVSVYQQCFTRLSQSDMNEFTCLDDLRKRYGRSADAINLRAKEQLTLMCKKFDLALCKNVVESMITLRETKSLADILRKSFPSLIDDLSITSLLPYVNHDLIASQDDGVDIRAKKMKDVAALLDMTQFAVCYLTITTNFADTLCSCHRMYEYFESLCNTEDNNHNSSNAPTQTSTIVDSNASIRRDLIAARDFLSVYRQEIWAAVQQHMITLLSSVYLTTQTIHIDDFLRILHAGYAFVTVGESFARLNSDGFRGMLHRKAAEYIKVFARDSFDHVRNALERDEWKVLKVSPTLTMTDVPEFKPRSYKHQGSRQNASNKSGTSTTDQQNGLMDGEEHKEPSSTTEANGMDESPTAQSQQILTRSRDLSLQSLDPDDHTAGALYESFLRGDNPFRVMLQEQLAAYDQRYQEKQQERDKGKYYRILNQHSNPSAPPTSALLSPTHVQSSIQKATLLQPASASATTATTTTNTSSPSPSPTSVSPFVLNDSPVILTASSYQTVQYIGRYINIMEDIKPLAADAFLHLQDLFDFYVYSVFCMFGLAQQTFFAEYFDKYLTLKKCVVGVKQRVEQGTFGAGIFASFAIKHSNPNEMMSPSSGVSSSTGNLPSAPNTPSGNPFTPSGQSGAAGFYASSAANPTKEKSLLGKLNKQLNTAISTAAFAADKVTSSVANTAKHTSAAFSSQQQYQQQQQAAREREDSKRSHPILVSINESIELDDEKHMYGVMERCIATESLPFIIAAFLQNHDRMVTLLKPSEVSRLSVFLTYIQQVYRELQTYMYRNLAPIMLPKEVFAPKISHVSWVLAEPAQRASPYVSSILTVLRAHDISIKANGGLPLTIATKLYDETLVWLTEQMIEAYATVKKCNTEGRGLMILDVTLLQAGLNKMLPLTATTAQQRWQHVTDYINAYYLTADEWVEWVRTHQDYSLSVIVSCIQCGCGSGMEKKEQKELLLNVSREWQRIQEEKEMEAEQRKEEAKHKEKEDSRL